MKTTWEELNKKLGGYVLVENVVARCGRGVTPNQFIVHHKNGDVFQSYRTKIGAKIGGQLYLDAKYHEYSNTTSSACHRWCGLDLNERRKGLKDGTICEICNID